MVFPSAIVLIWRTLYPPYSIMIRAFHLPISWQMLICADSIAFWQLRWIIRGVNMWRPSRENITPFMGFKAILNGKNGVRPFYPSSFLNCKRIHIARMFRLCDPFIAQRNASMIRSEMSCAISFKIPMICLLETNHIN